MKLLDILYKLQIITPFIDAVEQIQDYGIFLKDLIIKKIKIVDMR